MASLNFNAMEVAPQTSFTPVPAGVYTVMITDSELKPTKAGGEMVVWTLQVTDGEHSGRKIFARINNRNPSAEAERIGQSQLSAICRAAGVYQLSDTAQLHGKAVRVKVKIRKDENYGDSNEVSGYEAAGSVPALAQSAPAPAGAPQMPWKKVAA